MPSYQLAISNIAWQKDDDEAVYTAMQQTGFTGLELAPTRIFSEAPYENLTSALLFGGYLKNRWGFAVPSLQSIWYGQKGNIFNAADTEPLLDYTAQAFQFAHSLNCPVAGLRLPEKPYAPPGRQRCRRRGRSSCRRATSPRGTACIWRWRPTRPMYTNYLNNTADAFALVKRLDNPGLSVNLDLSTVLAQGEKLQNFIDDMQYVSHVHISEPGLAPIQTPPRTQGAGAAAGRGGLPRLCLHRDGPHRSWTRSAARWTILRRCSHDRI